MREAIRLNAALISQPFVRDDITILTRYNILEFCDGLRRDAPVRCARSAVAGRNRAQQILLSRSPRVVSRGRMVGQQERRLSLRQQERLVEPQLADTSNLVGGTGACTIGRSAPAASKSLSSASALGRSGDVLRATSYGATDDAVSRRALEEAFERGITFYDTASVYGDGHSEELIGECFRGRRREILIATKAGITSSFRGYDFSAPALRASRRRRAGCRPTTWTCCSFTTPAGRRPGPTPHPRADAAVRRGRKVGAFGFSTPTPEDALALLDVPGTAACLPGELQSVGLARDRHGPVRPCRVARHRHHRPHPARFRLPGGRARQDTVFPDEDHRSRWSRERVATWVEAADRLVADLSISNDPESRVAVALRFCLSFEAVATVIPGMLSPAQVLASVAVLRPGPLDAIALRRIEAVYRQYEARLNV